MSDIPELDLREQLARIDRERAEALKYNTEARQSDREEHVRIARALAEIRKLDAETRRFDREHWQGWQIVVSAMTAGAALFAASIAFLKFLG